MTTRWFAAVRPPEAAVRHLAARVADLALPRPTTPADWHVTLAFCGELSDDEIPAATRAIATTASRGSGLRLRLAGMGTFGADTVLFAALDGDVSGLRQLTAQLRAELDNAAVAYAPQPFHPHLTLARPRRPGLITTAQRVQLTAYQGPEWRCDAVRLYRTASEAARRYETVECFALGG